ncbi:hypothetical protein [Chryseobacterium sp. YIM B08800]|uniref:hypothetical protein n=1 Tax=Chryseobacterium sp. YIM B08800 TaxID=2984136 RepID=UPI00223EB1E3|nr:hypothetical protein [Chryseobacterium sp. YIM B08800]
MKAVFGSLFLYLDLKIIMDLTIDEIRNSALNCDFNISRLKIIIDGVNNAIKNLYNEELAIDWWESLDEKKEYEAICRLAILAFENYIESTINSFSKEYLSKFDNPNLNIDLIIVLANLITSKTDNHESLRKFNLDINNYPIYNGIILLNKDKNLNQIIDILVKWRIDLIYFVYPKS